MNDTAGHECAPKNQSIKEQFDRFGIVGAVVAELASTPAIRIHASDCSTWIAGRPISEPKAQRLNDTLNSIIEVLNAPNSIVPNLSNAASVKSSIAHLAKLREEESRPVDISTLLTKS